ncbi:MAG: hypothetical protein U1F42_02190 [Candidatus Competibacteraceae bacterium]
MNELIYNIPLQSLPTYRGKRLLVRAHEPAILIATLEPEQPDLIVGVQLTTLEPESEALNAWAPGLPVELVMGEPATEFPLLYRHTNLLENHPVRVVIPAGPGVEKAVKVAVSLGFAVRLAPGQPASALIEELAAVLTFYLRQSTVAQPIEYFHGALLGFYHAEPAPLWVLLDEDPRYLRYVTDEGAELLSPRLAAVETALAPDNDDLGKWLNRLLATAEDCQGCEFLQNCGGYFKWPRRDYDCVGVKRLFGQLRDAAAELHRDLDSASA